MQNDKPSRSHIPVYSIRSQKSKLHNPKIKFAATQTNSANDCNIPNDKITELLTEVAITLGHKAQLESELLTIKSNVYDIEKRLNDEQKIMQAELVKLKDDNYDKEIELSKLRVFYLEEQKALLSQISDLKSEVQKLNDEKEVLIEDVKNEKLLMESKLEANSIELRNELNKNAQLQTKLKRYKAKLKTLSNYVKCLDQEIKIKKPYEEPPKKFVSKIEPSVENMILTELFFKPHLTANDVSSLFFCNHEPGH